MVHWGTDNLEQPETTFLCFFVEIKFSKTAPTQAEFGKGCEG